MVPPSVRSILAEERSGGLQLLIRIRGEFGALRWSGDNRCGRAIQQSLQIDLQIAAVFVVKAVEFEGLKIALCRPHGKQHACLAAHRAFAHVKDYSNLDPLIQRRLQMQQSTRDRELVQSSSSLPSVF